MTNDATNRVRDVWERQANAWYTQREAMMAATRPIHESLVANLQPRAGQRILEIAAGPGETGFLAAGRLGNGRLLSTDIAPSMVEAARKRGAELGIANADYRVLDAQAMDLDDASVDGVICRWGLMLMPNPAAALAECRRVLKPGGRLVFAVFTGPDENPFASVPWRILVAGGHAPPRAEGWQPGILALADRTQLQALLDGAGFTSTQVEPVDMRWTFPSAADYWTFLIELTALGPLISDLPEAARTAVHSAVDERLKSFTSPAGVVLPSRCWSGSAVR